MTHTSRDSAIEVRNLTRVFRTGGSGADVKANDDLTFSIPRGQVFGLLGANGAGKTTLVSQLLGLVRPTSGEIVVEGVDAVAHPDAVKAMTGFLPQTGLSMRLVEVRRALHYTGRLRGQSETDARRQTAELIEELGLGDVQDRYVDQLSGGMTRLVNFGMALMGRPKLLILDEPTNELDPHNRRLVWNMVSRRSAEDGTTVLLVTHNVLEAESAVDQVAVMNGGRITAMGTPGHLKEVLGDRIRLELFVKDEDGLARHERELFDAVGTLTEGKRDGSYLVQTDSARMPELMRVVHGELGMDRVADFRLTRPTLEDVYLTLDGRAASAPAETEAAAETTATAETAAATGTATAVATAPVTAPRTSVEESSRAPAGSTATAVLTASEPRTATAPAVTGTAGTAEAAGQAGARGRADASRVPPVLPPASGDAPGTGGGVPSAGLGARARRMGVDLKFLWLEQMLEVRTTWSWVLMFGLLMPAAMVFGLTRIGDGLSDEESLLFIVSGAAIFSVANEGIGTLAQRIGALRQDGMMVYYASLPISRISFLAAMVFSRLLLILPGLITPMITAKLMYDTDFVISPVLLLVLPLACMALSAIGLAIGTLVRSMDLLLVIVNLMIFVLLLVAPVLIPIESLPVPLQVFGYLLPPTYAAESLRLALVGDFGSAFLLNIGVLTAMTAVGLAGASRWLRWRTA
ncbi:MULTISPECIES: ABC transporter ATP-binding protein/permease [Streptomyces]|uniref:Transport permease protein n=1 Tax=Streptomyces griseus subsp. griseus (strain JCM 4626 / CBS 651.72 / NBRC 13350 / KCC S-0626 / ISP 5235) TaxID=455632 RepID=B1W2R1_STRGG|nr:ABC transporter ATP-binding protein/permease [Streptomyces griseus]MBW3705063.1 ABC transporter ATP-binding protein/permease [Streptomyces griseus]BAG19425.1 putative ABC transporter ATP-binding protein [Streptomyces griseus subsp. griseus NBRC 13350]SEE90462.1 ABC-2 type transport system permease protein [Streptomyces griseus]SQA21099.1 ABC transporter ATP-binding protein [Streptomyces griseus]